MPDFSQIVSHFAEVCQEGDMVLTLGAGDVYRVGERLLEDLEKRDRGPTDG
jgi:UDP-N-acetylmuramate--alanine ligase